MKLKIKELRFEYQDGANKVYEARFEEPRGVSVHLSYNTAHRSLAIAPAGIDWAEWDALTSVTQDRIVSISTGFSKNVRSNNYEDVVHKRLDIKKSIVVAVAEAIKQNKVIRS